MRFFKKNILNPNDVSMLASRSGLPDRKRSEFEHLFWRWDAGTRRQQGNSANGEPVFNPKEEHLRIGAFVLSQGEGGGRRIFDAARTAAANGYKDAFVLGVKGLVGAAVALLLPELLLPLADSLARLLKSPESTRAAAHLSVYGAELLVMVGSLAALNRAVSRFFQAHQLVLLVESAVMGAVQHFACQKGRQEKN